MRLQVPGPLGAALSGAPARPPKKTGDQIPQATTCEAREPLISILLFTLATFASSLHTQICLDYLNSNCFLPPTGLHSPLSAGLGPGCLSCGPTCPSAVGPEHLALLAGPWPPAALYLSSSSPLGPFVTQPDANGKQVRIRG